MGYRAGYRGSDDSALGKLNEKVVVPNMDKWSGDHCMTITEVPGILVSNRALKINDPNLTDLAVTLLKLYGMEPTEEMIGRVIFDGGTVASQK